MKKFLVGGAVRDKLMGKTPKDFDYCVVLDPGSYADPFQWMVDELTEEGFKIFLKSPEHFTVRAQFPRHWDAQAGFRKGMTADFVLARKEGPYSDGRRPDWSSPGTLEDDLKRRDFTMNAIAMDMDGNLIDPFNGRQDIEQGIIRAVGVPKDRLMEDALRALRAIRFSVQLDFQIAMDLSIALHDADVLNALEKNIADERKMDELNKMFKVDAVNSLFVLERFYKVKSAVFSGNVNLMATMKQRGFK